MGLLNVSHSEMTQSVINLQADLLKNPFYLFTDKKGIPVDYYNLNTTRTTLDPSLRITYDDSGGSESSLRFNLIHDFYLYGLDRVAVSLESGEFGTSGGNITGDAIILPGTITPYPGDRFAINMITKRYQFNVTSVTPDTFENGGNYWRIEYEIFNNSTNAIDELVVEEFNFVSGNVGTNYTPIIKKSKWKVCKNLDEVDDMLKTLFKGLYFNDKVQTYTFVYLYNVCRINMDSAFFYDPYLIEFCIKHKLLNNTGDGYDFIDHKTHLRPEFGIKYSRSIWKVLEARNKEELPACKHSSAAAYIDDPSTIFGTRYEDYYELTYNNPDPVAEMIAPSIDILDPQIIGHILENQLFPIDSKYAKFNLLIKYFNNYDEVLVEDIIPLERIAESENNQENYFLIPMLIYIVEFYLKNYMARVPEIGTSTF